VWHCGKGESKGLLQVSKISSNNREDPGDAVEAPKFPVRSEVSLTWVARVEQTGRAALGAFPLKVPLLGSDQKSLPPRKGKKKALPENLSSQGIEAMTS